MINNWQQEVYEEKLKVWALEFPLAALVLFGGLDTAELYKKIKFLGY